MNLLHIFNGDSTREMFENTQLTGDYMVWREMLSEGESEKLVGSEGFLKNRKAFFQREMKVSAEEYEQGIIPELQKLEDLSHYEEVVLWFEYDLFCQINLMAALSLLGSSKNVQKVSLICIGKFPDQSRLLGLGELDLETFAGLPEKRTTLHQSDFDFASTVWNLYSSGDHTKLPGILKDCPTTFEYLPDAIIGHFRRFPGLETGLNSIELNILCCKT